MTDHVKDQLCARIEELEAEKMELNEQLDALQEESGALSAHVERMQRSLKATARLIAKKQVEALLDLHEHWRGRGTMRVGALLDKAIELQEEAEGGEV